MEHHTVHAYDNELEQLTTSLISMGYMVSDILVEANRCLQNPDRELVKRIKAMDKKVNDYDIKIERGATNLLALRQPMAIDLRIVISALRLAVMMERMGDLAKNTSKRSLKLATTPPEAVMRSIDEMVHLIVKMLDEVLQALRQRNDHMARTVIQQDEAVDHLYYKVMEQLETGMITDSTAVSSFLQLMFAVKNIERIGDYVTKIAKFVHYIVTGERLPKPHKEKANKSSSSE